MRWGHNVGSHHTHRCNYWSQIGGMAIDECGTQAGYPEGGTCSSLEGLPANGGTIMSYCHLVSGVGINFTRGFGQLPGDTMRYHVGLAFCLGNCALSGCVASNSYGSITAPTDNTEQLIDSCTYAGEYNTIYSVVSGQTYRFRSSNTSDYLTLTDALNNILTSGTTPITWTATFNGDVRLHVHTSSSCGTSSTCRSTYIQCTSCQAPVCVSCPSFDFTLTPTTSWQTHTSSHPASGCKIYKVSVTTGRTYTFKTGCGDGATANYDTYLELMDDAFCAILESNNDGCENGRSTLSWSASYTGDAYVRVRGNAGAGGTYTLAYIVVTAGSIQSGSVPVLVRIYPTLSEGEVWVEVRQAQERPMRITVYDARGREVYGADFPAMQQLHTSLRLREAGMYLIRVLSNDFEHNERVLVIR